MASKAPKGTDTNTYTPSAQVALDPAGQTLSQRAAAAGSTDPTQGGVGNLFGGSDTRQPPQPNKYIGVASPYYDQNPDGTWFLRSGYYRTTQNPGGTGIPGYASGTVRLDPKYYEGDEYALISGVGAAPETIAAIQAKMAEAKLMPANYHKGAWEPDSVNAFKSVLAYANQTTQDWSTALEDLVQSGASIPGPKGPVFTAHLSNPDDIKKTYKDVRYNLLGGEFTDDAQAEAFVPAFQAQELAAQRAAFNASTGGGGVVEDAPSAQAAAETQLGQTDEAGIEAKRYNDFADILGSVFGQKTPTTTGAVA